MEGTKDYYRILGVPENAAEEEIKSAYRRLAKEYHPDAHPGDEKCEKIFRKVNEAYAVLGDSQKRKAYDRKKRGTESGGGFRREGARDSHSAQEKKVDFENIHKSFAQFFGVAPVKQGKSVNPMDTTEIFERFMGIKR